MKTAGRENQTSRVHSAEGQNRSCSNKWAAKQEKIQPLEWCFFLTSPFIELTRQVDCPRQDQHRDHSPPRRECYRLFASIDHARLFRISLVLEGTEEYWLLL